MTCAFAIITNDYPNEREQNIGLLEGGTGLGLLIGPLLGSGLYMIGGFCLPFWTVGCICIAVFPFIRTIATVIKTEKRTECADIQLDEEDQETNEDRVCSTARSDS